MSFKLVPAQLPWAERLHSRENASEHEVITSLLEHLNWDPERMQRIQERARTLAQAIRKEFQQKGGVESLMHTYDLSNQEGIALMCLAEALLRIPDAHIQDLLIADKMSQADWEAHLGKSHSMFVNATTWALLITGKIVEPAELQEKTLSAHLKHWFAKTSMPIIRQATKQAMRLMGQQFVMAETIDNALIRADKSPQYRYSFDMLGESARTEKDAQYYFAAYEAAIHAIGKQSAQQGPIKSQGISIKLSALHPRFEVSHWESVFDVLYGRLKALSVLAKQYQIGMTIDAEETDRLEYQLALFQRLLNDPDLAAWDGLGIAVQAYQKRALPALELLTQWAREANRRIMIRLVKGAYWDAEIKQAQVLGLPVYPLFTRKISTDVSYLACAQFLRDQLDVVYPQFATHNAYTLSVIIELFQGIDAVEIQRLHGMGQDLHDAAIELSRIRSRVYAPVGSHQHLLAYLVRRLLENGANTSFVNQIADQNKTIDELIESPIKALHQKTSKAHPNIPLPGAIYGPSRENSRGEDLNDMTHLTEIQQHIDAAAKKMPWKAAPLLAVSAQKAGKTFTALNPANHAEVLGEVTFTDPSVISEVIRAGQKAYTSWSRLPVQERANVLKRAADLLEEHRYPLMAIVMKEGGKTLSNALGELREAVDFCRYYAVQAEKLMEKPLVFQGPTGESNEMHYTGRGVFVCISPWNFPLAIFTGQIMAALSVGNVVVAKPAEQTCLIADYATQLFYEAGVPRDVLQLLPGDGESVGAGLVNHPNIAGVIFTGSTQTAQLIQRSLSEKSGPIVPLIAETGGQNAMIVDSSALLEQVTADAIQSAFDSAGQRCSALRVLFVQEEIADPLITMIKGAMDALTLGDPCVLNTDVGPVIDQAALDNIKSHLEWLKQHAKWMHTIDSHPAAKGFFIAPTVCELSEISQLTREIFGPVLHIIRYKGDKLEEVVQAINDTGYGLTFGVHTRVESQLRKVLSHIEAGNAYVNRNMIGAVVGVQPFGGQGLSGTGPKAGGPNYLLRLVHEKVVTINTVAMGGNASLLMLKED